MSQQFHFSSIAWRSEVGLHREGNEDSGLVTKNFIAVADGMGGYVGGEIASSAAIKALTELIPTLTDLEIDSDSRDDLFRSSAIAMDEAIAAVVRERAELSGMGTTITSLALFGDQVSLLHIGDSRAYRIRGKKITQLSHDHTVVQELIDQGRLNPDEIENHPQRSFLTQALMGNGNIEPILLAFPVEENDIYLVCSDGLTNVVDESKINAAFKSDIGAAIDALIDLTYENGAPDNVSVVAAKIGKQPAAIETVLFGAAQ